MRTSSAPAKPSPPSLPAFTKAQAPEACPAAKPIAWWPGLALGGFVAAAVAARLALGWSLPLPQCWLRNWAGIPCPTCGCTRSLASWADFNFSQAFHFNPLFFLVCVGFLLWLLTHFTGCSRLFESLLPRRKSRVLWIAGSVLLGLNWLYLCLWLPK